MRCGEHCSKADYLKMKAKTDAFLKLVKKEDPLFLKYGKQLADDMSEYLDDFNAGETRKLVLIYEVPAGTNIESVSLMATSHSKGSTTRVLQ